MIMNRGPDKMRFAAVWIAVCLLIVSGTPVHAENAPKGRAYYEQQGDIVWEVPTSRKVIALTFDDGPNPTQTVQILELLKQYKARATFFIIGSKAENFPNIVRMEVSEGHELANHTFHHSYYSGSRSYEALKREIADTQVAIANASGVSTRLFRPPGGHYSEGMVNAVKMSGHLTILWSWHQDTEDWKTPSVARIVNKVLNNARGGDIVLFHDHVEGKSNTPAALKQILPELQRRGFEFITVSELLQYRVSKPKGSESK